MPSQDEIQRALTALPARSVRLMLAEFLALRIKQRGGGSVQVPLVTFHLRSGRDITGWVLDGDLEGRGPSLLVQVARRQGEGNDVAYLDPETIEALTVKDASEVTREISFGRVTLAAGEEVPGKLEIRRRLVSLSSEVNGVAGTTLVIDVAWEGIPDLPQARKILIDLLEDVGAVLREIGAAEMGRTALAGLKKVWIGDGPRAGVARQSDTLVITANFAQGLEGRLIRGSIRVEIEKLL